MLYNGIGVLIFYFLLNRILRLRAKRVQGPICFHIFQVHTLCLQVMVQGIIHETFYGHGTGRLTGSRVKRFN